MSRTLRLTSIFVFSLLGWSCSESSSHQPATNETALTATPVARFELACPAVLAFPLEANLPIPPHTWHGTSSESGAFFVRQPDGKVVHAQTEIVSRYANPADGADVVQLIAHVERLPETAPGTQIGYDVVWVPNADTDGVLPLGFKLDDALKIDLPDVVDDFLNQTNGPLVRAHDAYGNTYAGLLSTNDAFVQGGQQTNGQLLRNGHAVLQARLHTILKPIAAGPTPNTFLPHLFNVHAYMSAYAQERVIALDLRVSNGGSGLDPNDPTDDPLGKEYFKDIELLLPNGWVAYSAIHDPYLGNGYAESGGFSVVPIVKPIADGRMHVMPSQGQFHRRLVLTPQPDATQSDLPHAQMLLQHANLAFCRPGPDAQNDTLWSWWNPATARYFPQRHALPRLDHLSIDALRNQEAADYDKLRAHLESGQSYGVLPVPSPGLGWAHPWGVAYGGMTGGDEIVFWEGIEAAWTGSNPAYRYFELNHRMQSDRHANVLYNRDGRPTRLEQWVQTGPFGQYVDMFFYMKLWPGSNDPFGFDHAPTFQEQYVQSHDLAPTWESDFLLYEPNDMQHLVRYLRSAQVLAWLGNDALAKDDLLMQAELVRLSYHKYFNSMWTSVMETGLRFDQQQVAKEPHRGFDIGRGEGWAFQALNTAYALGTPEWRGVVRPLFDDIVDLVANGQSSCTGILQAYAYEKILEGKYYARQSIEQAILENALYSMLQTVYANEDVLRASQLKGVVALSTTSMTSFPSWSEDLGGPLGQVAVAPLNPTLPPFCEWLPFDGASDWIDNYQTCSSFALGYELTKMPVFIVRAQQMIGAPLLQKLEQSGTSNLGNRAALLRLAQDLVP